MDPTAQVQPDCSSPTHRLPCLVVLSGHDSGRVMLVKHGDQVLGRGRPSDISLDEKGISRRHVMLSNRDGRVTIKDLGSTNGCWCNGRQVSRTSPRSLRDGDWLQIGGCRLAFRLNHPDEDRVLRQLYQRATRDALTGLFNRASLLDRLGREVQRQFRYCRGLAVLQLDLDHFKRINDTHGHAAGDRVLAAVGRAILGCLRASDLAARIGGEEFAVVLPETGSRPARLIADKIRTTVEFLRIQQDAKTLKVTVSCGVAVAGTRKVRAARLLAEADQACYSAKRSGRNRVEYFRK